MSKDTHNRIISYNERLARLEQGIYSGACRVDFEYQFACTPSYQIINIIS
jgi:hypothetical protein